MSAACSTVKRMMLSVLICMAMCSTAWAGGTRFDPYIGLEPKFFGDPGIAVKPDMESGLRLQKLLHEAVDVDAIRSAFESAGSRVKTVDVTVDQYVGVASFDADLSKEPVDTRFQYARKSDKIFYTYQDFKGDKVVIEMTACYDGTITKAYFPLTGNEGYIRPYPPEAVDMRPLPVPFRFPVWQRSLLLRLREDNLELSAEQQRVDGALCYVVIGKGREAPQYLKYRVYCDPEIGFMPRRVEEIGTGERRELTRLVRLVDYKEIEPGLWFSNRLEVEGHSAGEIFVRNVWVTRSLMVNEPLPDDLFEMEFPPGTTVYDQRSKPQPIAGRKVPELDVAAWVNGEPVTLETIRGKVVVLAFWDSTHESSAEVVATLNALAKKHTDIVIIAFHRAEGDEEALQELVEKENITFRVALDKPSFGTYPGAMFEKCNVIKPPSVYITDTDGTVKYQDLALAVVEEAVERVVSGE